MTMARSRTTPAVAISVSESPDMWVHGLSDGHLRDAMAEIALELLSSGFSLAYGGDLRHDGFTRLLFELLVRYRDHPHHNGTVSVTDYLAWPVHIQMSVEELTNFTAGHGTFVDLVFLKQDGGRLDQDDRLRLPAYEPDEREWAEGLTEMRAVMRRETRARVVLGGRVEGYKGAIPGIAEETYLSLRARQPTFLLGGFGGCTRDIAETIGLLDPWAGSRGDWPGRNLFCPYSPEDLYNGLSREENILLGQTPHIHRAVTLVSRGLNRLLI